MIALPPSQGLRRTSCAIRRCVELVSCPRNSRYIVAIKMGRRLGRRVGGWAYRRIGVCGSKTAFRHGYNNQEVSKKLTTLCKRRHADSPIRSPSRRPIFIATLRAGASWLFFRVARSTRMTQIWVLRSRLEKQPTDLRQYTCYFGDRTLGLLGRRRRTRGSAPVPMLYRSKSLPERWIERIPAERSQFSVAHAFAGPAAFSVQISRTK